MRVVQQVFWWLSWALLGFNISLLWRSRRVYRESLEWAKRYRQSCPLESFIQALDECAQSICPLCSSHQGCDIRMAMDVNGSPLVMAEIGPHVAGWHHVKSKDGQAHQLPCLAAPLHRLSSQIFDDMMKEKEAA